MTTRRQPPTEPTVGDPPPLIIVGTPGRLVALPGRAENAGSEDALDDLDRVPGEFDRLVAENQRYRRALARQSTRRRRRLLGELGGLPESSPE